MRRIILMLVAMLLINCNLVFATGSVSINLYQSGDKVYADVFADGIGNVLYDDIYVNYKYEASNYNTGGPYKFYKGTLHYSNLDTTFEIIGSIFYFFKDNNDPKTISVTAWVISYNNGNEISDYDSILLKKP